MRKWIGVLLFLVAICFVPFAAFAHSGRTDSKGGHTDHSTGEYHYHHGRSAHQHKDTDGDGLLECPYDSNYDQKETKLTKILNQPESTYSRKLSISDIPSCVMIFSICLMFFSQFALLINERLAEAMLEFAFRLILYTLPFFLLSMLF